MPHDSTALLNQLRMEEKEREKEWRRQQMEEKRKAQEDFMAGLQAWEDDLLAGPIAQQMKAMWEVSVTSMAVNFCVELFLSLADKQSFKFSS